MMFAADEMQPSQKRRLYLHLGTHKTGTTTLQYFLHANMQQLYEQDFLYPSTGRHPRAHVQHTLIPLAFRPQARPKQTAGFALTKELNRDLLIEALRHEIELSERRNIILSSESFSTMQDAEIENFCTRFDDFDIIPILYFRNFVDMGQSLYQTFVTHGRLDVDFRHFKFEELIRLDISNVCRKWSQFSSRAQMVLRAYEAIKGNIVEDFLTIVGLNPQGLDMSTASARLNETLDPFLVVILRELRKKNINEDRIASIIRQLKKLNIPEMQTNIPADIAAQLEEKYRDEIARLSVSPLLDPRFPLQPPATVANPVKKAYVNTMAGALFSIGRAVTSFKP